MPDFVATACNGKISTSIEYFPVPRKRSKGGAIDQGPLGREVFRLTLSDTQLALGLSTLETLYREGALVRAASPPPDRKALPLHGGA
jgi:hypothetical protein